MKHILLCASLASIAVSSVICDAAPRKALQVGSIAGYYVNSDGDALYRSLRLKLIRSYNDGSARADFSGKIGDFPLVGQGIISGDGVGNRSFTDNFVTFDFMFLEPQDDTILMHSKTVMKNGRIVGLRVEGNGQTYMFRRVAAK